MLSIQRPGPKETPPRCTPNLLPCRIHHDGPVNASEYHWSPQISDNGTPESYFRGRKLQGRVVKVPEGYRGVVAKDASTSSVAQREHQKHVELLRRSEQGHEEDEDEEDEETKVLEEVGLFEEMVVWGHETVVETDDSLVKGLEEWIDFAAAIHQPGVEGATQEKTR
ncbi:MAG: hypothetical protein Q9219_002769 [cf. Caloplaca sp. 3 TL-2023]